MAAQRSINFASAMHELRSRRRPAASAALVLHGSFDKAAIMREAVRQARRCGRTLRLSWAARMSIALRTVWQQARRSMGAPVCAFA